MNPDEPNPIEPDDDQGEIDPSTSSVSEDTILGDHVDSPEVVPKARLDQEIEKRKQADIKAARYQGQIEEMSKNRSQDDTGSGGSDKPKVYTRSELRDLVDSGRMTSDQMDDVLDAQRDAKTASLVQATVNTSLQTTNQQQSVESQINAYNEVKPDIRTEGSEDRAKVQEEYDFLVANGDDAKDLRTQLKALRAAFGPVGGLKPLKVVQKQDTHMEMSTGGGADDQGGNAKPDVSKPPKDLSSDERAYYANAIQTGIYGGWDEVHEELKHADKRVRARATARG